MKHWHYTEASNTCKICGYETHSLPTFRRHVKLCSSSEAGSTNATTSLPQNTTISLKAKSSSSNDVEVSDLQMRSSENDAKNDGISTTGDSNTLKNGGKDIKLPVNEMLKVDGCAEVPPKIFKTDEKCNVKVPKSTGKDKASGSTCRQLKTSPKTTASLDQKIIPDSKKKVLKTLSGEKQVTNEPVNFVCTSCDITCVDERTLQSHIESCNKKARKFFCPECEFACDDDVDWAKHKTEKHFSGTLHSCSECLYKTPLKKNYDRHRACHCVNAAFKCDFCSYSSTGESAVRRHVSSYHSAEERETLEGSKESSPKLGSKSKQQKKKSSKYVEQSPAESESSDDLMKPVVNSSENVVDEDEAANDGEAMIGETGDIESQDIDLDGKLEGDIVWSCFWCKLDFKNRQEMDTHTKLEHSIELKDCMLYSLDKDTSSETLFELEQEQLPKLLTATLTSTADEKIHKCELCTYRGKRVSDLRQHFTRKHIQNSSEPNQKTCKRPSKEESPPANKSKKVKISKTASDESSTILAKLLQNDDPNSVYNPSNNGEESVGKGQKNKTSKAAVPSFSKNTHGSEHVDDDADREEEDLKAAANRSQTVTEQTGRGGNLKKQRNHVKVLNSNQGSDKAVEYFISLMCNYCGYLGDSPAEVERHTHTHTGTKIQWCPLCEYKTVWKCDMKRHLIKSHQNESSTPACLAKLLRMAHRPDGQHTVEELDRLHPKPEGKGIKKGSPKSSLKKKLNLVKMKVTMSPTKPGNVKDLVSSSSSSSSITPSKKLVKKAKQKLLIQQISQLVRKDVETNLQQEDSTFNVAGVKQEEAPLADGLQSDNNQVNGPDETAHSLASDESTLKRCHPFKCSECGKRSNWKWDIKKHIAEQHPQATLVTLNKDEVQKSLAEIIRIHHEKQLQAGQTLQARRIRLGTTYEQNEDAEGEDRRRPCSSATSCAAEVGDEAETVTEWPVESSLLGCRSIRKGMVDLDKLKRFKCSTCIYRSSFRGDISRHIRSKHAGTKCSVIVMAADVAAESLENYNSEWKKMRRTNPTADDDWGTNSDKRPTDDLTPKVGETAVKRDHASQETNGNGRVNQQNKAADNHGGNRGVKKKYGGDAEDNETLKRRIRSSQTETEMRRCNVCPYTTEKSDVLKLHMNYHQPQARNGYSCTYCPFFVNTVRLLDHHLLLHASKQPVCRSINDHYPKASGNNKVSRTKYICDKCPFNSNQRDLYLQHRSKHFEKSSAVGKCSRCAYWAPDKRDLSQHHKLHAKLYYPRTLENPMTPSRGDGVSCRCVFAEQRNDARYRCGCELQCLYCTFTVASVRLIRQHIVSCHLSVTDAVKTKFFDKTLDDADDYLFVPCKYQPSRVENSKIELQSECSKLLTNTNLIKENEEISGDKILISDDVLMSTKSDDALSVETTDMDLPELEMFSCGNSDISDKTTSPDFLEAELMEVPFASSKLRLHNVASELENEANFEAFSIDEAPSSVVETPSVVETLLVKELSLDEIDPMKFTEIKTSLVADIPVLEKIEPLELPVSKMISVQSIPTTESSSRELEKTLSISEVPLNETESSTSNASRSAQASRTSMSPETVSVFQTADIYDDYTPRAQINSNDFLKLLGLIPVKCS